ncbi:hypothetical protein BRDID11004_29160 [Bradyrhizobium diazoefficiens]|uniref:Uncharacterized protein n=1 Tax=Bradyrhizobium diazoefficiens TaxID=1355477 RepID=A0A810A008_9BRAD|nr:hypothetical protein F07S3_60100 [Bradyrhizobium diazoefficiens]BCA13862.1 hypothetical protein BDHF08_57090 [Bradyrhizobium diazoefficiens]BCE58272.1 hypothetical protein XF5B_57840 [Bradyrhizobium diazoefficiens]BCE66949.1 hypothetical protein XF6B_57480 [Bradyrhizobium diazoefficiens]
MPKTEEEQLAQLERDIALHREADQVEQIRRGREYHSWTPQDRADWETARAADAERLRECSPSETRFAGN